jgi:SAM-dependent methyltransferase
MSDQPMATPDDVIAHVVADLGSSLGVMLTALGVRTGIWRAMAGAGPLTAAEVATRTGLAEPYVREWLRAQAAGGYLRFEEGQGSVLDSSGDKFVLPYPVAAALLEGPGGNIVDACATMFTSMATVAPEYEAAFRSGRGFGWDERTPEHWRGADGLTRAALATPLFAAAIGALDGVADALRAGGTAADVGCGFGAPTIMIAEAFPSAKVVGFDFHDASVAAARKAAAQSGVAERVRFEVATATEFPGDGYGLVTFVDSLHDLGDPVGALARARAALAPGGAVLLVEPLASDRVKDNLTPLGRMFYAVSTLICTPNALSQAGPDSPPPLGTLAGEAKLRDAAAAAGLTTARRVPVDAPLNLILELRP